jgi:Tfp pilus assembly protein PilN
VREINLTPYDVVLQDELFDRLRLWATVFLGIVLLIFASFLIQESIVTKIDDEVGQLEERNRILEARYEEVKELQKKQEELARKASVVEALLARRNFTHFFVELQRAVTPSLRLTYVSLDKKILDLDGGGEGEWVETGYFVVRKPESQNKKKDTRSSIVPDLVIEGIAVSHDELALFINLLERSPRFHNVNLRQCRTAARENERIEFEIDAQIST